MKSPWELRSGRKTAGCAKGRGVFRPGPLAPTLPMLSRHSVEPVSRPDGLLIHVLRCEWRDGGRQMLAVSCPWWEIIHDFQRGGCIVSIRIVHGSNTNLLDEPLISYVDDYSDRYEESPVLRALRKEKDRLLIEIAGELKGKHGEKSGIRYEHQWTYTADCIKHVQKWIVPSPKKVRCVGAYRTRLSGRLNEYVVAQSCYTKRDFRWYRLLGPHVYQDWGKIRRDQPAIFRDTCPPFDLGVFQKGVEGIQVLLDSNLYQWNEQFSSRRGQGNFALRGTSKRRGAIVVMEPYSSRRSEITLRGEYVLGSYLGLPKILEKQKRSWREVCISSTPWPSDEDIRQWAYKGVNLLRIHEGMDWSGQTDCFWPDAVYPPYDARGMKELDRVIATAHRYGMKIIPYFSIWQAHPTFPAYHRYLAAWKRTMKVNGQEMYMPAGIGGVFGVILCPDSGWKNYLKKYIRTVLTRHAFDGVYFDWNWAVPCFNRNHCPHDHSGVDGLFEVLGWARRFVGREGLVVTHCAGISMNVISQNFSDVGVTVEEYGGRDLFPLARIPSAVRFMNVAQTNIVPNILMPRETDDDKRQRLREGIAKFVLLGTFPYSYSYWEKRWGYASLQESRNDPWGLYGLFDRFKAFDLSRYHLYDVYHKAVKTEAADVHGAVYWNETGMIIVVANVGPRPTRTKWRLNPGILAVDDRQEYAIIDGNGTQNTVVTGARLSQNGVSTSLAPFRYQIYYVRKHDAAIGYVIHNTRSWRERYGRDMLEIHVPCLEGQENTLRFYFPRRPRRIILGNKPARTERDWTWRGSSRQGVLKFSSRRSMEIQIQIS